MHRPLLLATAFLVGLATIAVAFASYSLSAGRISQASMDPAAAASATRYYAAVNHMIATGDPSPLREAVHPEVIDTEPMTTGTSSGLSGIERYLTYLHRASPDVRVNAELISGRASVVTALVHVRNPSPSKMRFSAARMVSSSSITKMV